MLFSNPCFGSKLHHHHCFLDFFAFLSWCWLQHAHLKSTLQLHIYIISLHSPSSPMDAAAPDAADAAGMAESAAESAPSRKRPHEDADPQSFWKAQLEAVTLELF